MDKSLIAREIASLEKQNQALLGQFQKQAARIERLKSLISEDRKTDNGLTVALQKRADKRFR